MSEVSDFIDPLSEPESSIERYRRHFGRLSVQAVLNMLLAYRPDDQSSAASLSPRHKSLIMAMSTIYANLLVSSQSQSGEIDLSAVDESSLELTADYLWKHTQMKKFKEYRQFDQPLLYAVEDQTA